MIEQSLKTYLDVNLGGVPLYAVQLPEKRTLPAITYSLTSSRPQYSCDGPSNYPVFIALNCWGECYEDAKALQAQLRTLLDGYHGVMGAHRADLVEILNESDDFEETTQLFVVAMTINLFHRSV